MVVGFLICTFLLCRSPRRNIMLQDHVIHIMSCLGIQTRTSFHQIYSISNTPFPFVSSHSFHQQLLQSLTKSSTLSKKSSSYLQSTMFALMSLTTALLFFASSTNAASAPSTLPSGFKPITRDEILRRMTTSSTETMGLVKRTPGNVSILQPEAGLIGSHHLGTCRSTSALGTTTPVPVGQKCSRSMSASF